MTTKRALVCLVLIGGLSGCADELQVGLGDSFPPPATDEEFQAATDLYVGCLTQTALRVDDGKLSPIRLALMVIPFCEKEFAVFEAVTVRGNDPYQRHGIRDNLQQNKERFVTDIVLRQRLNRELPP